MLDIDQFPKLYDRSNLSNNTRSSRVFQSIIRQNNKILIEATDKSASYVGERNRIASTFESLLRSLGLGVGVLVGGPIGSTTFSALAGGIGRGVGEYIGNRIYGKSLYELNEIQNNYRYKQLINYYALNEIQASGKLTNEFYNQIDADLRNTIQELGAQGGG